MLDYLFTTPLDPGEIKTANVKTQLKQQLCQLLWLETAPQNSIPRIEGQEKKIIRTY